MGFFRDKLLDLFVDESVDKLKQGITPIQYQKKLEDAKQSLKDFLLEHYGKRWNYNEIDKLVSNHDIIPQLIYWILEEDISVYQEIERFASTIDDTSLLKSEIISILMDLYKIAYEELAQIDNPELKGVVIRVSRQLQRLYDEAGKQLESVCQKGEEIQNSLEGIKAILQEYPLPSNIDIESILMQAFSVEKKYNPSIDYKQASEELIPTIDFNYSDITVISKEKRIMSIEEVFSHSWKSDVQNHICITGIGGIGKTVCVFEADYPVPTIYIPLRAFFDSAEMEYIDYYIRTTTLKRPEYYSNFLQLCNKEWVGGPNIIILLDGVNELDTRKVNSIFNELNTRWLKMPGIQFIITSRYDVETKLQGVKAISISVNELSKERLEEYFNQNHLEKPKDYGIWKIINTPFMLKLYLSSETIRKKRDCELADWKETINPGSIVWNYFQSELVKSNVSHEHNAVTALFFVAPFVAYHMVKNNQFLLQSRDFQRLVQKAIASYEDLSNRFLLPNIIEKSKEENYHSPIDQAKIGNILKRQLNLFSDKENNIQFVHQNFRDCLCAIY